MVSLSRRNLMGSLGLLSAATVSRPRSSKAATPVRIWWNQGFYPPEDQALRDMISAWEKKSGGKADLTFVNGPDLPAKTIAAMSVGDVPDMIHSNTANLFIIPQAVWNDNIVDVSDVVATQESEYLRAALDAARYYNNTTRKRAYYGVPIKSATMNEEVWRPMIEEAGYHDGDIPKTQDAYYDFFQEVQKKLRGKGKRIYGLGYSMASKEGDSGTLFHAFLVAYGGAGIVTPDGRLNVDDPAVRKAAVTAVERLTTPYKQGFVPPGAINWGDADNNNAFYAKQIVMTPNASISIAVAQMDKADQYYKEIITQSIPLGNDGKPVPSVLGVPQCYIPKGAQNVDGAKDLLKFIIQPDRLNGYLKQARGRFIPVMSSIVKNDPYWLDPSDPHRPGAVRQGLDSPTIPWWQVYNPAYAQAASEQVWPQAEANVTQNGMTPEQAVEVAIKRLKVLFEKYEIT